MIIYILQQVILLVLFLIASLFLFTFPGIGLIKAFRIKATSRIETYFLSTVLGLTSFTFITYALSFLNVRNLIWLFVFFGVFAAFKKGRQLLKTLVSIIRNLFSPFTVILLVGILGMTSINALSGIWYEQGVLFWSAHGHDGMWHIALIEQMREENFPFSNPEFAGGKLQNYHFFIDLLISEISRILHFSSFDLYFRLLPTLLSLLIGLSCFCFVKRWSGNFISGLWAMIFIYFLGNFGFIVTLLRNGNLNGESVFWMPQLFSVQGNPPQAAAILIMAVLAYCVLAFLRDREKNYFLPIMILGGTLAEFKVYAAVVFLAALGLAAAYELLIKKNLWPAGLLLSTLIPTAFVALPNASKVNDYLIFQPWWFIRTMVVASDKLNWMDLELKRQTYLAEHNFKRVLQIELTAFAIYIAGNLGVRIIGLIQALKLVFVRKIFQDSFDLFFLSVIVLSLSIPLLFLQKGVVYNIIQTSQYSLLFLSFLSAMTMGEVFKKVKNKPILYFLSAIIILLGMPTQLGLLWGFYSRPPVTIVSNDQITALNFLKNHSSSSSIVLTFPYDKYKKGNYDSLPLPINVWSDTGYVPAFSARKTLLTDQEQLEIMGYDTDKLFNERRKAFESKDFNLVNNFLSKYRVDFVYLEKGEEFAADSAKLNIGLIYNQNGIRIFKVKDI